MIYKCPEQIYALAGSFFLFVCGCSKRLLGMTSLRSQASRTPLVPKMEIAARGVEESPPPSKILLKEVVNAVETAEKLVLSQMNSTKCTPVLRALAEAKDIYEFLESLPEDEDLMHLQDSVETYSDAR